MERVYQNRNTHLKQVFDKPIQKYQREEIATLLSENGKTADLSSLTQFDAINIRNCYGKNPFAESPIEPEAQKYLSEMLTKRGLSLNRELCYVLPSEYNRILDYLDGFTRTVPALVKPSPRIDTINADKLVSFMDAKGLTTSIPVTALSKVDYDKLYGYVVSQGQTPECLLQKEPDRTDEFVRSIQQEGITEKKQLLLLQLRNQMNELLSLGIDPEHTASITQEIDSFRQNHETLELEQGKLSAEFKSLLRLNQELTYAESPDFLFGPLFNEKVHEHPDIVFTQERDNKEQKEKNKPMPEISMDI